MTLDAAFTLNLLDDTSDVIKIQEGTNQYITISTSNSTTSLTIDHPDQGGSTSTIMNFDTTDLTSGGTTHTINIGTGVDTVNGITKTINIGNTGNMTAGLEAIVIGGGTSTNSSNHTRIYIGNASNSTRVVFRVFSGTCGNCLQENGQFVVGYNGGTGATSGRIWLRAANTNFRFNSAGLNADYSEYLRQEDTSEPGDVMVFSSSREDSVKRSTKPYDSQLLGVVSISGTGYNNDSDYDEENRANNPKWANVGMLGHVYIKVTDENGPIQPGDPLTSSSKIGHAMKATKAGRIVGYALESYDGKPKDKKPDWFYWDRPSPHTIVALIQAGWYDPGAPPPDNIGNIQFTNVSDGETSDGMISNYGLIDDQGRVWDNVIVAKDAAFANLKSAGLTTQNLTVTNEAVFQNLTVGSLTIDGTLIADKIKAREIEGLQVLADNLITDKISSLYGKFQGIASSSAEVSTDNLQAGIIEIDKNLQVQLDAQILGKLTADGSLNVKGPAEFENKSLFHSLVEFFSDIIIHGNINFLGRPTFNRDTAGFAIIKKGERKVEVRFEKEYEQIPVVTANLLWDIPADTASVADQLDGFFLARPNFAIAGITTRGFYIILDEKAVTDLKFSWVALAVADIKTFESTAASTLVIAPTAPPVLISPVSITPTPADASPSPTPATSPSSPIPTVTPRPTLTSSPTPSPLPTIVPTTTSFLISPTPTNRLTQTVTILPNDLGFVRLREEPSTNAKEIDQIPSGTTVSYSEIKYDWYKVDYQGKTGWVSGTYVAK
jgi:hypothetical protein